MSKKKDYKEVRDEFEQRGYILLTDTYENNKQKLKFICLQHPDIIQSIKLNDLLSGSGCKFCGIEKRTNGRKTGFNIVKEAFANKGYMLISNEDEYINCSSKLRYECPFHKDKIQLITYQSIKQGCGCKLCANERNAENQKKNFEEIAKNFKEKEYTLISNAEDYKNSQTKLKYICSKHPEYIQSISWNNLMHGAGCRFCGREKANNSLKIDFSVIRRLMNKRKYILLTKPENYVNANANLKYICPNHPNLIQKISYHSLQKGNGCPLCHESKGEKRINDWLVENKIKFKREYKFDDLRDKRKLPYDFYVPSKKLLIEYQGEFHDGRVNEVNPKLQTKEDFEAQQHRDKLKKGYALSHNYKLLEIWYQDFNNIEDILRKELV